MKNASLKKCVLSTVLVAVACLFTACNNGGVSMLSTELYDGQMPGGTFYFVKYFSERPGYRGLKVEIELKGFGELAGIDQQSVEQVSEALIKHAKLQNSGVNYSEEHYYYNYWSEVFRSKNRCKLTFYYLVRPDAANSSLHFIYDYTTPEGKQLYLDSPCKVF